jgi:hypothetical protein
MFYVILDVFQNPVGFRTRPRFLRLKPYETTFLRGSCPETEVSEQLYYFYHGYARFLSTCQIMFAVIGLNGT